MTRRLDVELVHRRLAPSRGAARADIEAGRVVVDGRPARKPSRSVSPEQRIELVGGPARFVSRAGDKLAAALDRFALDPGGRRCLDIGASTGGFTDCLLRRGATSVVAVDVGTDQLHPRLRTDPRVEVREQTDVRALTTGDLVPPVDLITLDVSFISLRLVVPTVAALAGARTPVVALVKPQFEAGRGVVAAGRGVVADPEVWAGCLHGVVEAAAGVGLQTIGLMASPIVGTAGNVEFLAHLVPGSRTLGPVEPVVRHAVAEAGTKHT
ncbi:MAG: TlyA family RNA methyltransferase [Acidimicrobiales bacterium]